MAYTAIPDAAAERGTFFRLHGKVGNTLVEEYERVGKSVISVCKKSQKGLTSDIYGCDKVGSGFVIYSYDKESAFTAVKKGVQTTGKGVLLVNRRYTTGIGILRVSNMLYKRLRGWTLGRSLPEQNFVKYPPGQIDFISRWVKWFFLNLTLYLQKGLSCRFSLNICIVQQT